MSVLSFVASLQNLPCMRNVLRERKQQRNNNNIGTAAKLLANIQQPKAVRRSPKAVVKDVPCEPIALKPMKKSDGPVDLLKRYEGSWKVCSYISLGLRLLRPFELSVLDEGAFSSTAVRSGKGSVGADVW